MAAFTQEMKKELAPKVKQIAAKFGIKLTLSVKDKCELLVTIKNAADLVSEMNNDFAEQAARQGKPYKGKLEFSVSHKLGHLATRSAIIISEIFDLINSKNYDHSNVNVDYFDVGYYSTIKITA